MLLRAAFSTLAVSLAACSSSGGPVASLQLQSLQSPSQHQTSRTRAPLALTKGFDLLFVFANSGQGMSPFGGTFVDVSGNIFGTTEYGGADDCGTLFELTQTAGVYSETILHSFDRPVDGCEIYGTPVPDPSSGALYVTAPVGGSGSGYGTVVQLSPGSGGYEETGVYSFGISDGYLPLGRVAKVGSTVYVLASESGAHGAGSLIGLTQKGLQGTPLYAFSGGADGKYPSGGLVADAAGALYGTTAEGGSTGNGVVFKFAPTASGGTESVLWSFKGAPGDGASPASDALLVEPDGTIYGTTGGGGTYNLGTVFKLTPHGSTYSETILHSFGASFDGAGPRGGVVRVGDSLWGTTTTGGGKPCACGTIFSLSRTGTHYRRRVSFEGDRNGSQPIGNLFYDGHALYGTTNLGGSPFDGGTVYRYLP